MRDLIKLIENVQVDEDVQLAAANPQATAEHVMAQARAAAQTDGAMQWGESEDQRANHFIKEVMRSLFTLGYKDPAKFNITRPN